MKSKVQFYYSNDNFLFKAILIAGYIVLALMLNACGTYTRFVEKSYEPIFLNLPKQGAHPIAREFTYKYFDGTQINDNKMYTVFVADGVLIKTPQQYKDLTLYSAQPVTSGVKMSDVYEQRADEARRQGNTGDAAMNTQMSYSATVQEQSFERAQAGANLAFASVNALGAAARGLSESWTAEAGEAVAQYIRKATGAISDDAPKGTTLEVAFSHIYRFGGKQKHPVAGNMVFSAIATLKDKNGKIWKSVAGYTLLLKEGDIKPDNIPSDMREFVYLGPKLIPAHTRYDYSNAKKSYAGLAQYAGDSPWVRELAMVSNAAIRGLYEQLEFVKK